jgi:hypothetical protein
MLLDASTAKTATASDEVVTEMSPTPSKRRPSESPPTMVEDGVSALRWDADVRRRARISSSVQLWVHARVCGLIFLSGNGSTFSAAQNCTAAAAANRKERAIIFWVYRTFLYSRTYVRIYVGRCDSHLAKSRRLAKTRPNLAAQLWAPKIPSIIKALSITSCYSLLISERENQNSYSLIIFSKVSLNEMPPKTIMA